MGIRDLRTEFFDKPENIRKLRILFYVSLASVVLVDFFIHKHIRFPWDKIPGLYALYGFISCVLIIFVSKAIGHWLKKREDYYD
ncbi:MAG: hypothetical protein QME59_04585 [Candidatus Hydrothermarchaeota archaeon]|nr:hypothetical protein [Candidatus Hydrothermarchaeota archaeon]